MEDKYGRNEEESKEKENEDLEFEKNEKEKQPKKETENLKDENFNEDSNIDSDDFFENKGKAEKNEGPFEKVEIADFSNKLLTKTEMEQLKSENILKKNLNDYSNSQKNTENNINYNKEFNQINNQNLNNNNPNFVNDQINNTNLTNNHQNSVPTVFPNKNDNNFNQQNSNQIIGKKKSSKIEVPPTNEVIRKAVIYSQDFKKYNLVTFEYKSGDDSIKNKIFKVLESQILTLSKDVFGNIVIQRILEYREKEKLKKIYDIIEPKINELVLHTYACRVIQKLIEILNIVNKDKIKNILQKINNIEQLFTNQNGNHVVQKIIESLDFADIGIIKDKILDNVDSLINHIYGSRIIEGIIKKDKEFILNISKKIKESELYKNNLIELCKGKHSNYIIQKIIEENDQNFIENIYNELKDNIYEHSKDKILSNVIEKIIEHGNEDLKNRIGKEIIDYNNRKDSECISKLINDKYGNYVIQYIIENCSEDIRKEINRIEKQIPVKKRGKCWKYVDNVLKKYYKY